MTTLIAGLLDPLDSGVRGNCKVAFYDIQTALIASEQLRDEVLSVQDFQPSDISGVLFVVGVPTGQVLSKIDCVSPPELHPSALPPI